MQTPQDVERMRRLHGMGWSQRAIARELGCCPCVKRHPLLVCIASLQQLSDQGWCINGCQWVSQRSGGSDRRKPPAAAAGPDRQTRRTALEAARRLYGGLSGIGKRRLLDELQVLTGYHRKSLLRQLNRPDPPVPVDPTDPAAAAKPHHRRRYGPEVVEALVPAVGGKRSAVRQAPAGVAAAAGGVPREPRERT